MSSQTSPNNRPGDDQQSIGQLVSTAVGEVSTLVSSQIELAKAELRQSAQKGMAAGIAGVIALILAFVLVFFVFLTIAFVIFIWLPLWAAFLITTVLLLVLMGILGLIVKKKIEGIKAPEQTIESVQETKTELVAVVKHEPKPDDKPAAPKPAVPSQSSTKPTGPTPSSKGTP
ncbi:MAG: phage holin family protein [Candidatus Nanopelagicales bacterium]